MKCLDEALADIGRCIKQCDGHIKLMDTHEMREEIKCLYSEVFRFLGSAIKWYNSGARRKILNSLQENRADELKEHLDKIKSMCDSIKDNSHFRTQAEIRDFRLQFQHDREQQAERYNELRKGQMRLSADHAAEKGKQEREQERQKKHHRHIPHATLEDIGKCTGRLLQGVQQAWLLEDGKPIPSVSISGKHLPSLTVGASLFLLGLTVRRLTEDAEPSARIKRSNKSKGSRQALSRMSGKC